MYTRSKQLFTDELHGHASVSGQLCITQATEAMPKTNCAKSTILILYLEIPKDIAIKRGNP